MVRASNATGWNVDRPRRTITGSDVRAYAETHSSPEETLLAEIAATTRERFPDAAGMMVGPLQGGLLATLVAIARPRLVVEVGTFTGYSALAMAAALPPGGRIITCDVDPDHAALAQEHLDRSEHGGRVDLRLGPALETLETVDGPVDMAFVDADKTGYADYYEALLPLLSPHGFIVFDNVLWRGWVADDPDPDDDEDTTALRELNARLVADDRVEVVLLPIRDGISIVRPR